MIRLYVFYISATLLFNLSVLKSEINYLDPVPNSKFVNTGNSIIIGSTDIINSYSLNDFTLTVTGTKSGLHSGILKITNDGRKIIFKPAQPFALNERVDVVINNGLRTKSGRPVSGRSYSFYTQTAKIYIDPLKSLSDEINPSSNKIFPIPLYDMDTGTPPPLTVSIFNNPVPLDLFFASFPGSGTLGSSFIRIHDESVNPYYYQQMLAPVYDFKEQPNGDLTYYRSDVNKYYEMNIDYDVVDSFSCGNGYTTDLHEMRLLSNGHALLLSYDPEPIDMSEIVQGGDPNAIVTGLIVQEVDDSNYVYFQWRSWDHYLITDATNENLLAHTIDYVHGNSIEYDNDGNLMISARHLDEISKINMETGEFVWRWGGKNNQFVSTNDTIIFAHQHAVRRIANGHITMFDNGNFRPPYYSRAVEYSLNETNMTATRVWQYFHSPEIFSSAMGYVERLNNGNTLISWGFTNTMVTEVTPAGTIVLEASLPSGFYTYRAFKYQWIGEPVKIHQISGNVPGNYSLGQNYPNPFNPATSFHFDVPKTSAVEIILFDINGKEIKTLVNKQLTAGRYSASFDGSGVSSGVYFYRLKAGDFMQTRKMVLLK